MQLRSALAMLAAVSVVFGACYAGANQLTHGRADIGTAVFDWERSIPFVEWTIVPYLSIVPFFIASFFVPRDRDELRAHALRLIAVLALSIACYAAFPLRFTFERPSTSGATGLLFDLLNAVDLPYNRAPSLHISVLVILWARFAAVVSGSWRLALQVWFALIGVSVLTTYQHHVVDVPAGLLAGWLCVRGVRIAPSRRTGAPIQAARAADRTIWPVLRLPVVGREENVRLDDRRPTCLPSSSSR